MSHFSEAKALYAEYRATVLKKPQNLLAVIGSGSGKLDLARRSSAQQKFEPLSSRRFRGEKKSRSCQAKVGRDTCPELPWQYH